jgi:glycosyltransferase involved in cell wall biosynthesis
MDFALTGYPLSESYRGRLERAVGSAPTYLNLLELRQLPIRRLMAELRSIRGQRLFIALESDSTRALLPVFYCLAAFCGASVTQVVYPDLRFEAVGRGRMFKAMASAAYASAAGQYSLRACRREVAKLRRQSRIAVDFPRDAGRILYVMSNLSVGIKAGGSIGHIAGVTNGLLRHGWQVDMAAVEPPAMVSPEAGFGALTPPRTFGLPYELARYRFHAMIVNQIGSWPHRTEYAAIYQRLSNSNYAGVVLSRQLGVPLIVEYNGSEVWVANNWGGGLRYPHDASAVEDLCLQHAHLVVTVSDVLRDELIARGVEPHRIVSYPNCIDPAVFDPDRFSPADTSQLRQHLGFSSEARIAGFVGTFGDWHGVDVLAEAIRQLVDTRESELRRLNTRFLLVGDGAKMPVVQQILGADKYREFCALPGIVPQAQAPLYMAACDMLLSPHVPNPDGSRFFGSPTKLFEYMAMGKAIIASDLEQIGEILHGSRHVSECSGPPSTGTALFCRPGHVGDIVESILLLAREDDARSALGQAARRRALEEYTWDTHVEHILAGARSLHSPQVDVRRAA